MSDLETNNTVFVYGTLKQGRGNARLLETHDAEYLGKRVTRDSYVLGNVGFPYLFHPSVTTDIKEDYHKPVVGDLWILPDESCLALLDRLEDVPRHYQRKIITLNTGEEAWAYLQYDDYMLTRCLVCNTTDNNEWEWS